MKVIGVQHNVGNFEGKPYDNFYIFVVNDENKANQFGVCPVQFNNTKKHFLKMQASVMYLEVAPDHIERLVGKEIDPVFDMFNNVAKLNITK